MPEGSDIKDFSYWQRLLDFNFCVFNRAISLNTLFNIAPVVNFHFHICRALLLTLNIQLGYIDEPKLVSYRQKEVTIVFDPYVNKENQNIDFSVTS